MRARILVDITSDRRIQITISAHPDVVQVVETTTFHNIDDPLWMALPLLDELANAVNVEDR